MTAVVFYFQVHQPYRLRRYTFFDIGAREDYFDDELNELVMRRVAERCYLPMGRAPPARRSSAPRGAFAARSRSAARRSTQMEAWAPEALARFQELARSGAVEILCETSHHSLAWIGEPRGVRSADRRPARAGLELFGTAPRTFRNTELIVDREIAPWLEQRGFEVLLGEGADELLGEEERARAWRPVGCEQLVLLLRDYPLSDDIAFRFSNRQWPAYPLMADNYASWLAQMPRVPFVGLFMDYETFGEHQWAETGILAFMRHLPELVLAQRSPRVRDAVRDRRARPPGALRSRSRAPFRGPTPSATSRPGSATRCRTRPMKASTSSCRACSGQPSSAGPTCPTPGSASRPRTTSTTCARSVLSDGDVHKYFSPYATPHDAFITFMNVLDDFSRRVESALAEHGGDPETSPAETELP